MEPHITLIFFTLDPILLLLLLGAFRWCRQKLLSRPQLLTAQLQLRVRVELSLLRQTCLCQVSGRPITAD